ATSHGQRWASAAALVAARDPGDDAGDAPATVPQVYPLPPSPGSPSSGPPWSADVPAQCQAGEPSLQGGGAHGAAVGTGGGALTRQGIGEACEEYSECQRGGCVTNSLSPQKFCSPQAVFQQCLSWQKPNGHTCLDHTECRSGCCVTSSFGLQTYCTAKTIFLQCVPWRKPNGDYRTDHGPQPNGGYRTDHGPQPNGGHCTDHGECRSKCYIPPNEVGPHRCVPRSGVLVQCLPWIGLCSRFLKQSPDEASEKDTGHGGLTEKVCLSPEGDSQSFLSMPTWPVSTQSGGGCSRCHDSESTGVPRVSETTRPLRRQPRPEARTVGPEDSVALTIQLPEGCVSPDLDPVCALETCLDPEPRTCSGCSSRDDENLQVSDV
ncbi:hypothetical protein EI555_004048, partial [Monodon monoceros]